MNEGYSRIIVVAFSECRDEPLHRHHHLWVVVVGAHAPAMVAVFFFPYSLGPQPVGQTRWFLGVIRINPDNEVFPLGPRMRPFLLFPSLEGIVALGWFELLP